jgi:hypothetical protein
MIGLFCFALAVLASPFRSKLRLEVTVIGAVTNRLREEFAKLQVEINDEKSRTVDLERGESFSFLGFDFRYLRSLRGMMRPHYTPKLKKADGAFARAQRGVSPIPVATD